MGSNVNLCVPRMITVPQEEWNRLKQLEIELPAMLEKARQEGGMDRLKVLNEKRKENPDIIKYSTNQ